MIINKFTNSLADIMMFMSGAGAIIGGLWLLYLGEWEILIFGIFWIFFCPYIVSFLLLPGMAIDFTITFFENRIFKTIVTFLSLFYTALLMVFLGFCAFTYSFDAYYSSSLLFFDWDIFAFANQNFGFIPYALWSWMILMTPWQFFFKEDLSPSAMLDKSFALEKELEGIMLQSLGFLYLLLLVGAFSTNITFFAITILLFIFVHTLVTPVFILYHNWNQSISNKY